MLKFWAVSINLGYSVKSGPGYPAYALTEKTKVMLLITVTNYDPDGRTIVLDSRSVLSFGAAPASPSFPICRGYNNATKETIPYSTPITIPYLRTVTLNFTGTVPEGSKMWSSWFPGIFLVLYGYFLYPDGATSPYGQTLPFQATTAIPSSVSASLSQYFGATDNIISVSSYSGFTSIPSISWIRADGSMINVTHSKTPLTFKVPAATPGYYAIVISDGTNTVYATFYHT